MNRVKEINSFIRQAELMVSKLKPKTNADEATFFIAAMNWLTHRAGLRVLTKDDMWVAEKLYGPMDGGK